MTINCSGSNLKWLLGLVFAGILLVVVLRSEIQVAREYPLLKNMREDRRESRQSGKFGVLEIEASANERRLRLRRTSGVSESDSSVFFAERRSQLETVYQPRPNPYSDFLSKEVICAEVFKPVFRSLKAPGLRGSIATMYASSRLSFGVCSEGLAVFRLYRLEAYCERAQVQYEIEYFVPVKQMVGDEIQNIEELHCPE